jgi:prepilin peptidase CpaA
MDQALLVAQYSLVGAASLVLLCAAIIDLRHFLIPNWCSGAIFVLGVIFTLLVDVSALVPAVGVALALFLVGAVLFQSGVVGGGDVKLLAALGVWSGVHWLFALLFITACAGGVQSLVIFGTKWLRALTLFGGPGVDLEQVLSAKVAYGVSIAVGGLYVFVRIIVQIGNGL